MIELHAQIGDNIPNVLWQAHEIGNVMEAENLGHPCSLCKAGSDELHFHASDLSGCERKIYRFKVEGRSKGLSGYNFLNDGHFHEERILESIALGLPDGWRLKISGNEVERVFDTGDYKILCHNDALLYDPQGVEYGVECKAVKQAMWKQIQEEETIPDEWYGQCQAYMVVWGLERWYLIPKHRESSNILMPIRIDRDVAYIAQRLNKLSNIQQRIIKNLGQPDREHSHPKDYECLWCPFGNHIGDSSCWHQTK